MSDRRDHGSRRTLSGSENCLFRNNVSVRCMMILGTIVVLVVWFALLAVMLAGMVEEVRSHTDDVTGDFLREDLRFGRQEKDMP